MPVDNNRDIANGLAGTNRLRGGTALHIRRGGRAAPQVNGSLIEPDDATVAIGDADRHGKASSACVSSVSTERSEFTI